MLQVLSEHTYSLVSMSAMKQFRCLPSPDSQLHSTVDMKRIMKIYHMTKTDKSILTLRSTNHIKIYKIRKILKY